MGEEEKSNLYVYVYSDYEEDFIFKESKYTLADLHKLQQENQELKKQLEEINNFISKAGFVNIQQFMLDYCAKVEQQKEFIECLEKEIVDSRAGSGQQYYAQNHLRLYKEIIGKDINVSTKEAKNDG